MLTVKLTKTRLIDPQDDGLEPVVNRVCRGSVSPISLNLTIPTGTTTVLPADFGIPPMRVAGASAFVDNEVRVDFDIFLEAP